MPGPPADVWHPTLYMRFAAERARPLDDLLVRVRARVEEGGGAPRRVLDVGCGTGVALRRLADWVPKATFHGLDQSRAMAARVQADAPWAEVFVDDLMRWQPAQPYDLVVSNAVLHWVDDQEAALRRLASWCAPGGTLAVQIPDNRDAPAARAVRDLLAAPPWRERLGVTKEPAAALPLERQVHVLAGRGCAVDAWATTYHHVLADSASAVAWLAGTTLRPQLARLEDDREAQRAFLDAVHGAVAPTLEAVPGGVLFPFRRVFVVARLPHAASTAS